MKERLLWAIDKLNMSTAEKDARMSHWHFSTLPLTGLSDVGANFIPYLMGRWRASKKILTASESGCCRQQYCACMVAFLHLHIMFSSHSWFPGGDNEHTWTAGEPLLTAERLDASYDWLPAPPQDSGALSFFGNGCNDPSPYDLAGQVPPFCNPEGHCSYFDISLTECVHGILRTDTRSMLHCLLRVSFHFRMSY